MLIVLPLGGAVLGAFMAWRRKGNGFDMAQWAAVFAIIGFLMSLVMAILLARI
ncbi:MAG: hypothetical protein AAF390_15975 [Pseudomonadota bacterium]